MKPKETYRRCEYCDKLIKESSSENYKNNIIKIGDSYIFLNEELVKKNHVDGIADEHIRCIDGIYCNYNCLINYIKNILTIKK